MSLIKCSECGNQVSEKASQCPKCGCPIEHPDEKANKGVLAICFLFPTIGYILGIIELARHRNNIAASYLVWSIGGTIGFFILFHSYLFK